MEQKDTESILIKPFSPQSNHDLYRDYLKIKYDVFVTELGWSGLEDGSGEAIAQEDPFDNQSWFLAACADEGLSIGVLRVTPLKVGFPHRDLFEHHFHHVEFTCMVDHLCSFNALAVLPPYRRKKYRVSKYGWVGSVAQLLMLGLIQLMEREKLRGALLTASSLISTRLFLRLGFYVIDNPTRTSLHSSTMINMGIVFGSDGHLQAQHDCRVTPTAPTFLEENALSLLRYFEHRHQQTIGSRNLESFFEL